MNPLNSRKTVIQRWAAKKVFLKSLQNVASLQLYLKRGSVTGVFQLILRNF